MKIDLKDIRVGSILKYTNSPRVKPHLRGKMFRVTPDDIVFLSENPRIKYVVPVPLTEDLLRFRCGFKTNRYNAEYLVNDLILPVETIVDDIYKCSISAMQQSNDEDEFIENMWCITLQLNSIWEKDPDEHAFVHISDKGELHILQNAYRTISGKELTLKNPIL